MSTLTSSSTLAQIKAAYVDNASYAEDNSPAKARAFITACRILLLKLPRSAEGPGGGERVELEPRIIQDEANRAHRWLALNSGTGAGVVHRDMSFLRA